MEMSAKNRVLLGCYLVTGVAVLFALVFVPAVKVLGVVHERIELVGSAGDCALLGHLGRAYGRHEDVAVNASAMSQEQAFRNLSYRRADFIFSHQPHGAVAAALGLTSSQTSNWVSVELAREPVVAVVGSAAGCIDLTLRQLRDVTAGRIVNWRELGQADLPIQLGYVAKAPALDAIFAAMPKDRAWKLSEDATSLDSPRALARFCADRKGALVLMPMRDYDETLGRIATLDGVSPHREQVASGAYGLTASWHVVYDTRELNQAARFLDFLASSESLMILDKRMAVVPQKRVHEVPRPRELPKVTTRLASVRKRT